MTPSWPHLAFSTEEEGEEKKPQNEFIILPIAPRCLCSVDKGEGSSFNLHFPFFRSERLCRRGWLLAAGRLFTWGAGEGTLQRSSHQTRDNEKASVGGQQSLPRSSTRCIKLLKKKKNWHILCQIVCFMTYLRQRHYLDFKVRRFKRKKAEEHAKIVVKVTTRKDLKVVDPGNPLNPTCPALGCSGAKVGLRGQRS